MTRFDLTVEIPADRTAVFDVLTDPERLPRWLYGTENIKHVTGPLSEAGTTFVQRVAKGIERPGGVIGADPPAFWHLRLAGMGERADLAFRLEEAAEGTRLTLSADIRNGPSILGPIVDRLTWRIDRRLWSHALERIGAEIASGAITPVVGGVYVLEGGGRMRIGHVLDANDQYVHLELWAGFLASRPSSMREIHLEARRMRDYLDVRPTEPTVRSATRLTPRGANSLLADGGFGLSHMPITLAEFRRAEPLLLGSVEPSPNALAPVTAWREGGGAAFGEPREPHVGAYFSVALQAMGLDAMGFGIVKLLHQQMRGVHVRVYSNTFAERPTRVDEASLELRPVGGAADAERAPTAPVGVGHVPLSHASFRGWQPIFIAMALVDPDELLGYEEWKLATGGFF